MDINTPVAKTKSKTSGGHVMNWILGTGAGVFLVTTITFMALYFTKKTSEESTDEETSSVLTGVDLTGEQYMTLKDGDPTDAYQFEDRKPFRVEVYLRPNSSGLVAGFTTTDGITTSAHWYISIEPDLTL